MGTSVSPWRLAEAKREHVRVQQRGEAEVGAQRGEAELGAHSAERARRLWVTKAGADTRPLFVSI
jgi:hypothetical protein